MKKKGRKRRSGSKQLRRRKRKIQAAALALLVFAGFAAGMLLYQNQNSRVETGEEVRGIWLAYVDFKEVGLYNKSEDKFRENAEKFFRRAEKNSVNTVFFHVRAFRDASYLSDTFPMSRYIWDKEEEIPYDPLEIMTELAHEHNMQIHAWLNPYRNTDFDKKILDPAASESTEEILTCVREILDHYEVDGIHFDDYFYTEDAELSAEEKMKNVNRMVRSVYETVKEYGEEIQFGISPAGNTGYCESIGADIKTWMSEEGYVDYLAPQIYWTDQHSATWREKMFSDTLKEWISLNEREVRLYIGLALYRAGEKASDDPGWGNQNNNLARQLRILREEGCQGYILFSAKDLYRKGARQELENYRNQV